MFKRVLVIGPHADDGELGCGGTMAKFAENGVDVFYYALSIAEESVPQEFPSDILSFEFYEAIKRLGLDKHKCETFRYKVRNFDKSRQEILDLFIDFRDEIQPDLVIVPSTKDTHQDHNVVTKEATRAFKRKCSILGFESPRNNLNSDNNNFFVRLGETHILKKIDAVKQYGSQDHRYTTNVSEFVKALATVRGEQVDTNFAEAFEMVRWIL